MDNPEKLATLGKQDTGRRKNQKHNTENSKEEQHGPTKTRVFKSVYLKF
jgi:hypothetical protein